MRLAAHIIGTNQTTIAELCSQLLAQDITATHQETDGFFNAGAWTAYEIDLSNYEAISASTMLVVANSEPLNNDLAQQICYAIDHNKPVVLTNELTLAVDVDRRLADIILHHAQQFHVPASLDHLGNFLHTLPREQQYSMTPHEKLRIAIAGRDHFRTLLQQSSQQLPSLTVSAA